MDPDGNIVIVPNYDATEENLDGFSIAEEEVVTTDRGGIIHRRIWWSDASVVGEDSRLIYMLYRKCQVFCAKKIE